MSVRMPMSEETKRKISLANSGKVRTAETKNKLRQIGLGKKHSEETKKKMRNSRLGVKLSQETKEKISLAHRGKKKGPTPEDVKERIRNKINGDKSPHWKASRVGYRGIHLWIERTLGRPKKCSHCQKISDDSREMQWANKSGRYLRDVSDWIRLCRKCHVIMDGRGKKLIK